jgi:hypothetical protein
MKTVFALVMLVAAGAFVAAGASASRAQFHGGYLQTPSGNIHCDFGYPGKFTYVRCGLKSGFKPEPPTRGRVVPLRAGWR